MRSGAARLPFAASAAGRLHPLRCRLLDPPAVPLLRRHDAALSTPSLLGEHAERVHIDLEDALLLLPLGLALLAQAHDLAQRLHVEPERLRLEVLVADVARERLLL